MGGRLSNPIRYFTSGTSLCYASLRKMLGLTGSCKALTRTFEDIVYVNALDDQMKKRTMSREAVRMSTRNIVMMYSWASCLRLWQVRLSESTDRERDELLKRKELSLYRKDLRGDVLPSEFATYINYT